MKDSDDLILENVSPPLTLQYHWAPEDTVSELVGYTRLHTCVSVRHSATPPRAHQAREQSRNFQVARQRDRETENMNKLYCE